MFLLNLILQTVLNSNSNSTPQLSSKINPVVHTNVGVIQGLNAKDGDYAMFLGVPYAKINESNPFGPSSPYPKFNDTFNATNDDAICPQVIDKPIGEIDCLMLNIYVPGSSSKGDKLPVLVWIYGGLFEIGYAGRAIYGPKFIVRHDVIMVAMNYRVGIYGFMCLDIAEVPGNQGIKDQLLAMKWVKENIEAFGGDVNKITVFGESAGSRSIDLHLMFQKERLFNAAILESGTALVRGTVLDSNPSAPMKLAAALGFDTDNVHEALAYLAISNTYLVLLAAKELNLISSSKICVEKHFDGVQRYVYENPVDMKTRNAKGIHILIGNNNDEQIARYANNPPSFFKHLDRINERLNETFDFDPENLAAMEAVVRHFYLGDKIVASEGSMRELVDFDSQYTYIYPTKRGIDKYVESEAKDIYFYIFSYVGGRNMLKTLYNVTAGLGGASHADELGYLFDMDLYDEKPVQRDQRMIDRITKLWTNFAKYGNPTPVASDLLPVLWKPISKDHLYCYKLDSEIALISRPFQYSVAFWDLFYMMNWKKQKGYKSKYEHIN